MLDLFSIVWSWLGETIDALWRAYIYLWKYLGAVFKFFLKWVEALIKGVVFVARSIRRQLKALLHLKPSKVWEAIKKAKARYERALDWWDKHYVQPIQKVRDQIFGIYNRFFKPIVRTIDSLRVGVRILAVFNKKLAARIDARLWDLETKIMWPITTALKRLNSLSSQMRAIQTRLGFLDRVTLLESLRRDASLVLEVLTNPRGRIFDRPAPSLQATPMPMRLEIRDYLSGASGELAEDQEAIRVWLRDQDLGII